MLPGSFLGADTQSSTQQYLTTEKRTTNLIKAIFFLYFSIAPVCKCLPNPLIFLSLGVKYLTGTSRFENNHIPESNYSGELNRGLPQNLPAASRTPGQSQECPFSSNPTQDSTFWGISSDQLPLAPHVNIRLRAPTSLKTVVKVFASVLLWFLCYTEGTARECSTNFYDYKNFPHAKV